MILLVEDNKADSFFVKQAFENSKSNPDIRIVEDGDEALDFLHKRNQFADERLPDLILLDLNLPRIDGLTVLKEIKNNPELKRIPVIVLTSSMAETDVKKSYDNYASCYLIKPVGLNQMRDVITATEQFWFGPVVLCN